MKRRIAKCIAVFYFVILFTALLGALLPESMLEPIKNASSRISTEKTVIPGGFSVGMQMDVKGALIVGVEQEAGPRIGDMIVKVNNQPVNSPEEVMELVGTDGSTVELTVVRNQKRLQYNVDPYFDQASGSYKLGLWIKERIAGIGTLTFYDPETKQYGALGHGIYEPESGVLLETKDGKLLNTRVEQIQQGSIGNPGALQGVIFNFKSPIGEIKENTDEGVFGTVIDETAFQTHDPVAVGVSRNVKEGKATIMTTIEGTTVEPFEVEITNVNRSALSKNRNMKLKVTDKRLLENCGGIVQGMSGSPIIQDGKLIGAVTHVLVNDPTRGYGIFIENMLEHS